MLSLTRDLLTDFDSVTRREWLVTNGIGGFACGTLAGMNSRRYHGLLIASLRPPVERVAMVAKLDAIAVCRGQRFELATNEFGDGTIAPRGYVHLESFVLDGQIPVWTYLIGDTVLEQRVWMAHGANTTYVSYRLVRAQAPVDLELIPLCTYRDYHAHHRGERDIHLEPVANGVRVHSFYGAHAYRVLSADGRCIVAPEWYWNFRHRAETERGLDDIEDLFRPAIFRLTLLPGQMSALVLTAENREPLRAGESLARERARQQDLLRLARERRPMAVRDPEWIQQLTLAADQFIVARSATGNGLRATGYGQTSPTPSPSPQGEGLLDDAREARSDLQPTASSLQVSSARGSAQGATVIAGYPWFSDWGRDTMIALPGLALSTGRLDVAASVLRTFAQFVGQGLLPNRFPDAGETPEYNTVDATLWYFVAIDAYVRACDDRRLLEELYPVLRSIVDWHRRGTRYAIHVDPTDGLLHAGEPGVQLTWMDAKCGDWVVTPRIGKPVEINALWFNTLAIMRDFARLLKDTDAASDYAAAAERTAHSFRSRFWFSAGEYLYDVIDGPEGADESLRPNQLLAISLRHSLFDAARAKAVVDACARELWTPVGLRSLARNVVRSASCVQNALGQRTSDNGPLADARYRGRYAGSARERDSAYHQGTVWSWLLGPFVAAHYRVYQDAAQARRYLEGMNGHLREACIGQVSEIFDGDAPFNARGCFAQAWGVAELLRVWGELDDGLAHEDRRKTQQHAATLRK